MTMEFHPQQLLIGLVAILVYLIVRIWNAAKQRGIERQREIMEALEPSRWNHPNAMKRIQRFASAGLNLIAEPKPLFFNPENSITRSKDRAPFDYPGSAITLDDCREIPTFQPALAYAAAGYPGSWCARHKETGQVIRVIDHYKSRSMPPHLMIKDTQGALHDAEDFERIYAPGDWQEKPTHEETYQRLLEIQKTFRF